MSIFRGSNSLIIVVIVCIIVTLSAVTAFAEVYPYSHTPANQRYTCKVINCDNLVSLRAEPDTNSDRVAEVPLDAIVTFCEDFGDFTFCYYDWRAGYILTEYLGEAFIEEEWKVSPWPTGGHPIFASSGIVGTTRPTAKSYEASGGWRMNADELLPDEAKLTAIASGIVPADVDFSSYKIDRLMGIEIRDAAIADLAVSFPIVPAYSQGSSLLAIVAIVENGAASYTACSCEVGNDNDVHIVIPAATVDAIQNGTGETVMIIAVG